MAYESQIQEEFIGLSRILFQRQNEVKKNIDELPELGEVQNKNQESKDEKKELLDAFEKEVVDWS